MKARYRSHTLNKESIHIRKRENYDPYPCFFFLLYAKRITPKAASDCSMGETICVTPTICTFGPYFQPITVLLSVMSSIINNLAFIPTHVCKAQLSTVCTCRKGMAITSHFICRANWAHMQQFVIP